MEEFSSGESIRIRSSKSVRVDHYLSAPLVTDRRRLTDNIIEITSARYSVGGMFMEGSEVSAESSVSLDIEAMLFSEDCNQCPTMS